MALQRIFLGWNRPGLARVAEYLIERWAGPHAWDLSGVTVVVPGARAGRRLLEILVDCADQRGTVLSPPEIVTLGRLPELLYVPKRPFADELTQQLAWIEALRQCKPKEVEPFLPATPATGDLPAWLALAEMLARVHRELAADGLSFVDVETKGPRVEGFCESPRWRALATVQRRYLETLDRLDLWDVQTARLVAVRQRECQTRSDVVLAGTVDLNRVQRRLLDQIAGRTTALVLAPADLSDRFDEYGCLRPAAWQELPIRIDDAQIEWVAGPAEQAAAAVRTIAGYGGCYAGDEITVGVPDPEVVPFLEQYLRQCGVAAHRAAGRPIGRTAPCCLLAAAAEHLTNRRFATLAALVRHPDVQDWLAAQGLEGDYFSELDSYIGQHMPYTVDGPWLGPPEERRTIERVHRAVEDLLAGLRGSSRPLPAWGQPMLDLLTAVFGARPLDATAEPDRTVLSACERIRSAVLDLRAIPAELAPSVSGAEAIRLVLRQVEGEAIAAAALRGAIELLGWLELPLDDAPALVVTGFNEGIVPSAVRADLFLPNQLRTELELDDSDRRYARDAYALSVLAASRERLKLIGGRRSASGDPLTPSRLLLACDAETAARRTVRLFSAAEAPGPATPLPGAPLPGRERSVFDVPRPEKLAERVTSMRVTEFRDYLACPYRYYLRHRLGLGALDDSAEELDGGSFGALAHEVLRAFGASEVARSADPDEIFACLSRGLDQVLAEMHGPAPLAAVRIQAEQLRLRLKAFAAWQANWRGQGWQIEHVEASPGAQAAYLKVGSNRMYLRGRIDRIDVRPASGERIVFDYKTADAAVTPEKIHRKTGEWIDLQLPLYRHLVKGMGISEPVRLGYIVLPKDTSKTGEALADWDQATLESADHAAVEVVEALWQERFWPPASPPPAFFDEFAAICLEAQFGPEGEDEEP